MSYNVTAIPKFSKELKKLAQKYPSMKIASKGKGKSGGSRVITYVHISQTTVYLLSIYDKSEQENISNIEIQELLSEIPS